LVYWNGYKEQKSNEMSLKKIVIIGPESTGKSTLCNQLALHYNTSWCPEYAREFLLTNGTNYSYESLLHIARGQLALEDKTVLEAKNNLFFIDTDMYVIKVWSEFVFGKCESWVLDQVIKRKYDFYLLCNTDLPWVKDELREYPDLVIRQKLFHLYKDILVNQSVPWAEIGGTNEGRFSNAVTAIDRYIITTGTADAVVR
jgi:NadR type nicotinamide-nucleotide adenylyltransferase